MSDLGESQESGSKVEKQPTRVPGKPESSTQQGAHQQHQQENAQEEEAEKPSTEAANEGRRDFRHIIKFCNIDLRALQRDLLEYNYRQTITKLQIFQRGLRLNASVCASSKTPIMEQKPKDKKKIDGGGGGGGSRKASMAATFGATQNGTRGKNKKPSAAFESAAITGPLDDNGNGNSSGAGRMKSMPSIKVLNEIKIDRELDTLIGIYKLALKELHGNRATNTCVDDSNANHDGDQEEEDSTEPGMESTNEMERTSFEESSKLEAAVLALKQADSEVDRLQQEVRLKQDTLKSIKAQIEAEKQEQEERIHMMDEKIATIRHNLRNVKRLNDLEFDLVEKWEANRQTQAEILCKNEEKVLEKELKELQWLISGELRIRDEVEKFNEKQFDDYREKIKFWQDKYEEEMGKEEQEARRIEKLFFDLRKTREKQEQIFAERVEFVRAYLEIKAEEQRLYEAQMYRINCAVRIQAWWRGVMVRRGLGPFKKKIKKGKKGKGKGK